MGMACAGQGRQAPHHPGVERRQPSARGIQAAADHRRMGTCVLHRLPQPQGSVRGQLLGPDQLEEGAEADA